MASNTAGSVARHYHVEQEHYIRAPLGFAQEDTPITVGVIPAGSIITRAGVVVTEAFNDGTAATVDIGFSGTAAAFADDLDVSAIGLIVNTTLATSSSAMVSSDTTVTAVYEGTDSDATEGAGIVFVTYMPNQ